jgi:hypothetical protein
MCAVLPAPRDEDADQHAGEEKKAGADEQEREAVSEEAPHHEIVAAG